MSPSPQSYTCKNPQGVHKYHQHNNGKAHQVHIKPNNTSIHNFRQLLRDWSFTISRVAELGIFFTFMYFAGSKLIETLSTLPAEFLSAWTFLSASMMLVGIFFKISMFVFLNKMYGINSGSSYKVLEIWCGYVMLMYMAQEFFCGDPLQNSTLPAIKKVDRYHWCFSYPKIMFKYYQKQGLYLGSGLHLNGANLAWIGRLYLDSLFSIWQQLNTDIFYNTF